MYDYIKGTLTYKTTSSKGSFVTIEAGGAGYFIETIERDINKLQELNSECKFYTVLVHREDKMFLCGFLKREDRDIFNILTSVSGVGTKMALALMNSFMIYDLVGFVSSGDYKSLTKAKGVGPKLAQKIILELKDKLYSYESTSSSNLKTNTNINSSDSEDAQLVLHSLGYDDEEIKKAFDNISDIITENSNAEDILKKALQFLSV